MDKEKNNINRPFTSRTYERSGVRITVNLPCLSQTQRTKADIQIKDRITETVRQSANI